MSKAIETTPFRLMHYLAKYGKLYPGIWQDVEHFISSKANGELKWANWCFMPLAGAFAIVSERVARAGMPPDAAKIAMVLETAVVGALAAWRPTQGIYRFDPDVFESVWDTPMDGNIPVEFLYRLPEYCIYIETPGKTVGGMPLLGFFAHLEDDANHPGHHELRTILDLGESRRLQSLCLHLDAPTIAGMVASVREEAARTSKKVDGMDELLKQMVAQQGVSRREATEMLTEDVADFYSKCEEISKPLVSLLLYLCSATAEIQDAAGSERQPERPKLKKTKRGMRLFPAERPSIWETGYRMGRLIRAARGERTTGDGTHSSPEAHIRRAHWHGYWLGPKSEPETRKFELRWMPPIPVGYKDGDEIVPTIRPVR